MLGTLCTLITVLSCVSGATVVTQKPPVLSVSKGGTATMDCNVGTVTDWSTYWYKQVPGGVPQFVLRLHEAEHSPNPLGTGFPSNRFTTTRQSNTDSQFIIKNVEAGDSAVYYCSTWDNSAKEEESHSIHQHSHMEEVSGSLALCNVYSTDIWPFTPHTDNMLGTLCTLITVLSCVGSQTLLTQKPTLLSLTNGQTASMDCNIGPDDSYHIYWYKQVPGSAPQYVLCFYHSHSSPSYGAGFSSSRFTSTAQSETDYQLIITNVEAGDSAVYYCEKWVNSVSERVSQ
ncbi:uncharacterized protein LOC135243978 [Anguilla rostrata]|uniref:uncharacterized protein LOC135243978 n=1 Tax=Anguilla rostrata TaxID=7938 RepID=UPI0030CF91A8